MSPAEIYSMKGICRIFPIVVGENQHWYRVTPDGKGVVITGTKEGFRADFYGGPRRSFRKEQWERTLFVSKPDILQLGDGLFAKATRTKR